MDNLKVAQDIACYTLKNIDRVCRKNNIEYLTNSKIILTIFKIVFIVFAVSGIIFKSEFLWIIIDNLILIMIIINSYSIIKLIKYEKEKI